jgi:uncharacterized protein
MTAIRCCFVLTTSLISFAAFANDAPPSDASIQELTMLAHSQEVYRGMKPQMDAMISSSIKEASQGQTITPERQAVLDRMRANMVAAFDETYNAEAMQNLTLRIYQATYTQDEVDGLIAFYKTPAGQALINKNPLLMQNTMDEMRALMHPMMQRINQIKNEGEQEMKALPAHK